MTSGKRQLARGIALFALGMLFTGAACSSADDSPGADLDGGAFGASDGGGAKSGDASTSSCLPGDVSTFTGGDYHPPTGAHQGKCDDDGIEAYVDCRKNSNPVSCEYITTGEGAGCLPCIETASSAAAWGPVVLSGSSDATAFVNEPGCLALALGEGTSAQGCGASLQKAMNCEAAACGVNCAGASAAAATACAETAENSGCSAFTAAATTACAVDAGGAQDLCYMQTTEDGGPAESEFDYAARVAKFFCGFPSVTADAGTGDGG
ncbi:MAG TPA: hypothetical protein VF407_17105 [Polyangiaceae bacterium]